MNFLLIIILIILFSIYFSIGIYFFKNKNDIGNFTDFVYINQYIFYATGFLNIFLSHPSYIYFYSKKLMI